MIFLPTKIAKINKFEKTYINIAVVEDEDKDLSPEEKEKNANLKSKKKEVISVRRMH